MVVVKNCVYFAGDAGKKRCWFRGRIPDCTINGCGESHHKMLHKALKDERGQGASRKCKMQTIGGTRQRSRICGAECPEK
jgi:hypothetical protein